MVLHGAPQGGEAELRRRSCGVFSPFGDTLDATLPRSIVETNTPGAPAPRIRRNFAEPQRSRKQAEIDATLHAIHDRLTPEAFRTRYGEGFTRTDQGQRMSATRPPRPGGSSRQRRGRVAPPERRRSGASFPVRPRRKTGSRMRGQHCQAG
jgi:hypothetical protein